MNKKEIAVAFQISLTGLDDWIRRGCPVASRGTNGAQYRFSLPDVVAWRVKDLQSRVASAPVQEIDIHKAELRKVNAEADLKELDLARRRGLLVNAQAVRALWRGLLTVFRVRVMAMPMKRAREFSEETDWIRIREVLDADCRECLASLSEIDPSSGTRESECVAPGGTQDVRDAPTENHEQSVGRRTPRDQPRKKQRARAVENRPHAVPA